MEVKKKENSVIPLSYLEKNGGVSVPAQIVETQAAQQFQSVGPAGNEPLRSRRIELGSLALPGLTSASASFSEEGVSPSE